MKANFQRVANNSPSQNSNLNKTSIRHTQHYTMSQPQLSIFLNIGNAQAKQHTNTPSSQSSIPDSRSNRHWISSVQSLSHAELFATPWTVAHQASLSITNSWSLFKLMSIESVMLSCHLILFRPLLLPTFSLSQQQGLFQGVSSSHQVAKVLEFQLPHQSFQ